MAEKLIASEDLGYVGESTEDYTEVIEDTIHNGYIPISLATVAGG